GGGGGGAPPPPPGRPGPGARLLAPVGAARGGEEQAPYPRPHPRKKAPSPPPPIPRISDLGQSLPHASLPKKSTHAGAEGRRAHGLTPLPAEPAGRGTRTPSCTGSVRWCQRSCEWTTSPASPFLSAPFQK